MSASRSLLTGSANSNSPFANVPEPAPTAPLVRLSLFEATQPALLVRFLRPFAAYVASRGVALDAIANDAGQLAALHDVLSAVDRDMPVALQQALVDVAELATEGAHDHVLKIARTQQLGLFGVTARTTPEDLAFEVYLDHPELFRSAHALTQASDVRGFVEFVARDATPLVDATTTSKRLHLGGQISAYFAARNRTGYCDLRVSETETETTFVVIHGRPPRNHGAIESDDRRTRVAYVPDKHDTLVVDRRTGRLAVNAQYAREQDFYRAALGRVFWGDEDHFVAEPVFTGAPLAQEGTGALGTHGVPGLREVLLRELRLEAKGPVDLSVALKATDLAPVLDSEIGKKLMELGAVAGFKLALVVAGRPRAVVVDVDVPSSLSFDRRFGSEIVREYLIETGFMRMPEARDADAGAA
ncbi:MAG: hypothetical protein ACHREM_11105 [Polyangiales bacterium]